MRVFRANRWAFSHRAGRASESTAPGLLGAALAVLSGAHAATAADIASDAPDPIRETFFDDATFTLQARS